MKRASLLLAAALLIRAPAALPQHTLNESGVAFDTHHAASAVAAAEISDAEMRLADCVLGTSTELVVVVQSRRGSFEQRAAIRRSWGDSTSFPRGNICVFYAVSGEASAEEEVDVEVSNSGAQCSGDLSFDGGDEPACHCGTAAQFDSRARECASVVAAGTSSATSRSAAEAGCAVRRCRAFHGQLAHCMLHHERTVHRDVVLMPVVEEADDSYTGPSGSPPPFGFVQMLQVVRDLVRIRVGDFGVEGRGGEDYRDSAADFLFVTDAHVVNLPALFESRKLLPVGGGQLLKRFPVPTNDFFARHREAVDEENGGKAGEEEEEGEEEEQEEEARARLHARLSDGVFVSRKCPSVLLARNGSWSARAVHAVLQAQQHTAAADVHGGPKVREDARARACTIVPLHGPELTRGCTADQLVASLAAGVGTADAEGVDERVSSGAGGSESGGGDDDDDGSAWRGLPARTSWCWRRMKRESDGNHRGRPLLPEFSIVVQGSRRRAVVTVVATAPDAQSTLVTQLLSQLRVQSLQPHVHLVLVVPTASNPGCAAPCGRSCFVTACVRVRACLRLCACLLPRFSCPHP
jgi:hypothetical protein